MMFGNAERGVSAAVVATVARALGELGVDVPRFDDADVKGYVAGPEADALLDGAAAKLDDPALGVSVAERMPAGSLGLLDYALFTGERWGDAIRRVAQYYAVASERVTMSIECNDDEACVALTRDPTQPSSRHWIEFSFAVITSRARQSMGPMFQLRGVEFVHGAPPATASHERYFASPVRFGQAQDRLVFDAHWLEAPLKTGAATLADALDRKLAELVPPILDPTMLRVREALQHGINEGHPTLEGVADRLGTSTRSLQRTLRERGTGFKEQLDAMRRDRALALLRAGDRTVAEIGHLLGFADTATFFRAFRRWTGTTPGSQRG
jgi:AraC-like DNA-binding protein